MNPHVEAAMIVTTIRKDGITQEVIPCPRETRPDEEFAGVPLADPGWIRVGGTGYLDQQTPEDFPPGVTAVQGRDEHGRQFVSLLLVRAVRGRETVGVATLFRRYAGQQGPWVTGERRGILSSELVGPLPTSEPFRRLLRGEVLPVTNYEGKRIGTLSLAR